MRTLQLLLTTVMLIAVGDVYAYTFEDKIDYWNLDGSAYSATQTANTPFDAVAFGLGNSLSYTHNILDGGYSLGDQILSASLELDFTNDLGDLVIGNLCLFCEHVTAVYDGLTWNVGEVDNGQYVNALAVADLSILSDGLLNVTLSVGKGETAWLDHSRLYGTAEPSAVPEPGALALLGAGLLGLAAACRRSA